MRMMFRFENDREHLFISKRKLSSWHMKHVHEFYELIYMNSGERQFFINDRNFQAIEGDLLFMSPNVIHRAQNKENMESEGTLLYFDETAFGMTPIFSILKTLFEKEYIILRLPIVDRRKVESLFSQMLIETSGHATGNVLLLQTYLIDLLVFVTRYLEDNQSLDLESVNPMHSKVAEVVRYINKHYSEPLNLSSLAKKFFVSPPYLSKIFKEATGYTLIEYLNSVRVKEAIVLLKETNMKVLDISMEVGFGSVTHFGRVFKEVTGHAPKHYKS